MLVSAISSLDTQRWQLLDRLDQEELAYRKNLPPFPPPACQPFSSSPYWQTHTGNELVKEKCRSTGSQPQLHEAE